MVNVVPRNKWFPKKTKRLQASAFALLVVIMAYQNTQSIPTMTPSSSPQTVKETANNPPPIHLCRASQLHFPKGSGGVPIRYQCAGQEYDEFGAKLLDFASDPAVNGNHRTWGRRPFPIPSHKTVFILGNSHTRQITHAMICQFADQVKERSYDEASSRETFHFQNNSTLHVLINSPLVYSRKWDTFMEQAIGQSLKSLDAFVLGVFNGCYINNTTKPTNFSKAMLEASRKNQDIEFCTVDPPSAWKVTKVFQGPVVFVSAFSAGKMSQTRKVERFINDTTSRDNLYSINSRKYIDALGIECSSNETAFSPLTGRCGDQTSQHRCNGPLGGHADLVAFDIVEALASSLI
jgi:hypothetical protein